MIDSNSRKLSIARQCDLLSINKSTYYYKQRGLSKQDLENMKVIDEIYTEHPYFGARRMSKHLEPHGITIGRKAVSRYYRIMAIETVYPKMNLSKRNQAHKMYPYLLSGVDITKVNQVWSTDITYIRMSQGFVYLVAVIDWFSRYILSWKISISLDADFCIEALEEAIEKHGQPEIFNTDQGSQFTSKNFLITELTKLGYKCYDYINNYNVISEVRNVSEHGAIAERNEYTSIYRRVWNRGQMYCIIRVTQVA